MSAASKGLYLRRRQRRCHGGVLVIAMILLVVIGLTAAASMRHTLSNERAVNNLRLEALAQQFAELGLRYCEYQMQLPEANRANAHLEGLDAASPGMGEEWRDRASWPEPLALGVTAPTPTSVVPVALHVPDNWVTVLTAESQPFKLNGKPQCFVEKTTGTTSGEIYRVTARGFSPDYAEDRATRGAIQGSVVWLQSDLVFP